MDLMKRGWQLKLHSMAWLMPRSGSSRDRRSLFLGSINAINPLELLRLWRKSTQLLYFDLEKIRHISEQRMKTSVLHLAESPIRVLGIASNPSVNGFGAPSCKEDVEDNLIVRACDRILELEPEA
ncbi:MAG: hypothetical protein V4640_11830 [Verrucomicrobiota bacterium]